MDQAVGLPAFLANTAPVPGCKPWPRHRLNREQWAKLTETLERVDWTLMALWAEPQEVHLALYEEASETLAIASLACPDGEFPSLSRARPSAIRPERAIQDLTGLVATGLIDSRPWLDHGQFGGTPPLGAGAPKPTSRQASDYRFLPAEGDGLHEIAVGPGHAGIIEPGHFRFHANGEAVARLEARLGYVHKGIEALMQGRTAPDAAKLAARISGDSTVAHSLAFARAVEAALDSNPPARALWLRALMSELERIANHLGDIGAICNDASFALLHSQCTVLRERVLQAADACFGHRLMMDRVVPGGVTHDLSADGNALLLELVAKLRREFEPLVEIYDNKPSLLDRTVSTGIVSAALVHRFAAGGFVGRASARGFDARSMPSYPPYDVLDFEVPVFTEGDVNARVWVRIREISASLGLIEQILAATPEGPIVTILEQRAGEGAALVEGFRGDIFSWVRLDEGGRILRYHARDPSWFQWPLLEAAIEGNIVADFPLCNKSFNCSYSGHDL